MNREKGLTFKVTVEYLCHRMITETDLKDFYNGDAMSCYKFISNDFKDSATSFADKEKVIKVEVIK
jgi:hypothetical protein